MKRFAAAALLAAAVVPAVAGAQPLASQTACGVGMFMGQGDKDCRFMANANTLGLTGVVDGTWTLSHRETTAACTGGVITITTTKVVDKSGGAGPAAEPDLTFTPGITYTLEMTGNGGLIAGGPSGGAPDPAATEPAEKPLDKTNGAVAGTACS
jgi:hypothetical protein